MPGRKAVRDFVRAKHSPGRLQSKLFVNFLAVLLVFLVVTSVFYFNGTSALLIDREQTALNSMCESVITDITGKLNEMDQLSSAINYFSLRNSLTPDDLTQGPMYEALTEYILTSNAPRTKADQVNIYSNNGYLTQLGSISRTSAYDSSNLDWLEETLALKGRKKISMPYRTRRYSPGSQTRDWFISMYRAAFSSGGTPIGAIETVLRCRNLFGSITSTLRRNADSTAIYICDSNGTAVYPYSDETPSVDCSSVISAVTAPSETAPETVIDPATGRRCRYAMKFSSYTGWYCLALRPESSILAPVYTLIRTILLIACGAAVLCVVLSWQLSRRMIEPLKHLRHIIRHLRLDTLGTESVSGYTASYEELQELYTEFETMNDSLRKSLAELEHSRDLELHSRVLALQTQMNPHFYYNTLSCISILAEDGRTGEVSQLCRTLSMIMRYISDHSSNVLTVGEELDYIEKYLYCMRIRYQDSLVCVIDVPECVRAHSIPKLLIQPLVENAVKYGTDCIPPWRISVTGEEDEHAWTVTVTDTGNGFSPEVLKDLKEKLAAADRDDPASGGSLSIGGMGMVNTYIRWRLFAGGKAVFEFGNTPEGHAYVRVGCRKEERT